MFLTFETHISIPCKPSNYYQDQYPLLRKTLKGLRYLCRRQRIRIESMDPRSVFTIRAVNSRTRGWRIRREDSVVVIRKRRRQSRVPGRNVMKAIRVDPAEARHFAFCCSPVSGESVATARNKTTRRYIDSLWE